MKKAIPEYIITSVQNVVDNILEVESEHDKVDLQRARAAISAKDRTTDLLIVGFFTAIRSKNDNVEIVEEFLRLGLSPDCVDLSPVAAPAIVAAVRSNNLYIVRTLIGAGASLENKDANGIDALTAAKNTKNSKIITALIEAGASKEQPTKSSMFSAR